MASLIARRRFLRQLAALAVCGHGGLAWNALADPGRSGWTSATQPPQPPGRPKPGTDHSAEPLLVGSALIDGSPSWVATLADGRLRHSGALPERGHGVVTLPEQDGFVLIGRSPGRFAIAVTDLRGTPREQHFATAPDRHFSGHACCSSDGTLLYTTESESSSGRGLLGVREIHRDFRQIAELDLHGIGPHDLLLRPDGRHLVVAIGGLLIHPAQPGVPLNLDTMVSGLHTVDTRSGEVVARHDAPFPQLSVRHLALDRRGNVWFGCQYEGLATDRVPLAGCLQPGAAALRFLDADEGIWQAHRQYIGSVACAPVYGSSSGTGSDILVLSSPRGHCLSFWRTDPGSFLRRLTFEDGCAVAPLPHTVQDPATGAAWLAASGKGRLLGIPNAWLQDAAEISVEYSTENTTAPPMERAILSARGATVQWDNHAATLLAASNG